MQKKTHTHIQNDERKIPFRITAFEKTKNGGWHQQNTTNIYIYIFQLATRPWRTGIMMSISLHLTQIAEDEEK